MRQWCSYIQTILRHNENVFKEKTFEYVILVIKCKLKDKMIGYWGTLNNDVACLTFPFTIFKTDKLYIHNNKNVRAVVLH